MKKLLDKVDKQKLKKEAKLFVFIAIGGAVVIVLLFLIYQKNFDFNLSPDKPKEKSALKTDLPNAEETQLHGDKRVAYEKEKENAHVDVGRGAQNLSEIFPSIVTESEPDILHLPISDPLQSQKNRTENIKASHDDALQAVEEFYSLTQTQQTEQSQAGQNTGLSDEEIILLRQEEARRQAMEQFDLMMQKYIPQSDHAQAQAQQENSTGQSYSQQHDALTVVSPVIAEKISVSSGLRSSRRSGFYGISQVGTQKNTIRASVYGKHVIQSGQMVRLRMDEPMQVGSAVLPAGSIVIGRATLGEDRLFITIHSIAHSDVIYSVNLDVYDTDGMLGLNLPGSMEMEAVREIASDVANALGTSATNSAILQTQTSASEQLKTDVGRGLLQGTSRYVGRKLQEIKITVQDKHKVYLLPKNQ